MIEFIYCGLFPLFFFGVSFGGFLKFTQWKKVVQQYLEWLQQDEKFKTYDKMLTNARRVVTELTEKEKIIARYFLTKDESYFEWLRDIIKRGDDEGPTFYKG